MILRESRPEDAEGICAVWNPYIADTTITFTTDIKRPDEISDDICQRAIENRLWIVAENMGRIRGFAGYGPFRAGPGYVNTVEYTVFVASDHVGNGLGRRLVDSVLRQASLAGISHVIGGVSGENEAGIAFHEALGFQKCAHIQSVGQKFGRELDLILFQKRLQNAP